MKKWVLDDEPISKHTTTPGSGEQPQVFEEEDEKMESQPEKKVKKPAQPYELFFKWVLHLTAQKIV